MIVYKNTAKGFREHVDRNMIRDILTENIIQAFNGMRIGRSEQESWNHSLGFMERIVRRSGVADDCGILLEYTIPVTSKRIDFIIAGQNENGKENFVIIELKQWQSAEGTDMDGIVKTYLGGRIRDVPHPSYQANGYKDLLMDYNETIDQGGVDAHACAYLHNYHENSPEPLKAPIYSAIVDRAPIYLKDDYEKLETFIRAHVGKGKGGPILYKIEKGKIRPSKKLIDYVSSMFDGNQEFILLDEQKVAYELASDIAMKAREKTVVVISGGPGTGKSVISVNLLGQLLKKERNVVFVAPNASFRAVLVARLAQDHSKERLSHLFKGSAGFIHVPTDLYDTIIVDEAHRLKDGRAYQYHGENQIRDIIRSSKTTIFFVDENQMIRPEDIGSIAEIKRVASEFGAILHETELSAQFRCSGAEGYVNWLDDVLQIRPTANYDGWNRKSFEFKIFTNPNDLYKTIKEKNGEGFRARLLAGYAWKWTSATEGNQDAKVCDVEVPEFGFRLPWNSRKIGTTWAIDPSGIDQVGCIHSSQGLEFDYVGVIIGDDLKYRHETGAYSTDWNAYKDVKGKLGLKNKPEELTKLVQNIYKVLMTRGMKGCYVYFTDKETERYFQERINSIKAEG